jgi:two-component system C4-dicarboxylate transport response regulator DctD
MRVARSSDVGLPRLLLVDDDPAVREALGGVLEAVAEVETCPSAESAVFRIERKSYDIVVAGYALPGMNGVELLGAVNKQEPAIAGLLITASADYCKSKKQRQHRVLLEPVEPSRLCSTVKQLAAIVRMRRTVSKIRGDSFR